MDTSPAVSPYYTTSTTNFSFALYRELSDSVDGNLFASTYSVHLLMLLMTIGSKSKTNDELTTVLRLPKDKSPNFEKIKSVIEHIEDSECLTVANGVFSDKAFDISPDYESQARNYFKSEVRKLDFAGNPSAGETEINEWTKAKTNGKISKLFDSGVIDKSTLMVLASAVHFQNKWKVPFTEVKNEKFCLNSKTHIDIKMMHQTEYYEYYKDEQNKFAVVQIPYERKGFDMLVVLPDTMDGLKELEKTFLSDSTKFPILLANLTTHKVILALPKFKFLSDLDLKENVRNLGCRSMFETGADFSKMTASGEGKLKVDNMKHKTYVDVNELGTEAAGITGTTFVTYSGTYYSPNIKTVTFHACHPFLFIIKKGNDIVFMGRLTNPNA